MEQSDFKFSREVEPSNVWRILVSNRSKKSEFRFKQSSNWRRTSGFCFFLRIWVEHREVNFGALAFILQSAWSIFTLVGALMIFWLFLSTWCNRCREKSLELVCGLFWNVCYQNVSNMLLWCSGHFQEIGWAPEVQRHFNNNSALLLDSGGVICCRRDQKYDKYILIEEHYKWLPKFRIEK